VYSPKPKIDPLQLPGRTPVKTVDSHIGDEGLVGNWLFHLGAGGTLRDFSGEGNHGTLYGPSWIDGPYGWALDFTSGRVEVPHDASLNPAGNMTLMAWVNTDVVDAAYHMVAGKKAGGVSGTYKLYQLSDNTWGWRVSSTAGSTIVSSGVAVEAGEWVHLAGTVDAGTIYVFVNGAQENSGSQDLTDSQGVFSIGSNVGSQYFDGQIKLVRMYNRASTEAEISEHFEETRDIFGV